jgi:hypothetical protein
MPDGASGLRRKSLDCRQPVVPAQRISCSLRAQFLATSLTVATETTIEGSGPTNLISEARLAKSSAASFPSMEFRGNFFRREFRRISVFVSFDTLMGGNPKQGQGNLAGQIVQTISYFSDQSTNF